MLIRNLESREAFRKYLCNCDVSISFHTHYVLKLFKFRVVNENFSDMEESPVHFGRSTIRSKLVHKVFDLYTGKR